MTQNLQIQTAEVTFRVKYVPVEGMILPDKVRAVSDWLPIRHGVLLNEYMRWCNERRGSKQEFAKNLELEILQGKHPILSKTSLDTNSEPFTYYSIMSQLDWIAQEENKVITYAKDSTEKIFHPNNLMLLTTKQKAEESRRSREKQVADDKLVETLKSLAPEARKELIEVLSQLS